MSKGINIRRYRKRLWRYRDMCSEDESKRPSIPLDSVMGMIRLLLHEQLSYITHTFCCSAIPMGTLTHSILSTAPKSNPDPKQLNTYPKTEASASKSVLDQTRAPQRAGMSKVPTGI